MIDRPIIKATIGFAWCGGAGSGAVDAMKRAKEHRRQRPNPPPINYVSCMTESAALLQAPAVECINARTKMVPFIQ